MHRCGVNMTSRLSNRQKMQCKSLEPRNGRLTWLRHGHDDAMRDVRKPLIPWALVVGLLISGAAGAEGISEFWPELNYFYRINPQARVFLDSAHAKGKESDERSLDLGAYLDFSFKPNLLGKLRTDDWQRSRSFWARVGYDRIFNVTDESGREVAENRGIVAVHGKAPLPADVWLEARARTDLRWIGDEYSTRYRARLEATREFTVRGHTVVPYVNYEWFYDTRYDAWARTLATAGAEVTLSEHFRIEVYVAGQDDDYPQDETLGAVGLVAKWYH